MPHFVSHSRYAEQYARARGMGSEVWPKMRGSQSCTMVGFATNTNARVMGCQNGGFAEADRRTRHGLTRWLILAATSQFRTSFRNKGFGYSKMALASKTGC